MKTRAHAASTTSPAQPPRHPRRGPRDAVRAPPGREQEKHGAYKRVTIFLGQEAAIELRRLMRDGRSVREVIETLLLEAKSRRDEAAAHPERRR